MCKWIRTLFWKRPEKIYDLNDVFGCSERIPAECPTFIERNVHRLFSNNIKSYNINVVYGESRQGKTWMVDRYCKNQLRVGCQANMTLTDIKIQMLNVAGVHIRKIEHSITDDSIKETSAFSNVGRDVAVYAGLSNKKTCGHSETISTSYNTVEIDNQSSFLNALKVASADRFYIFDNFHYLDLETQRDFCSLLKEFNYQGIRIIIIGVWKDASRITALAPDLVNRCGHVDMGSWKGFELDSVIERGEKALNVTIGADTKELFKKCCAQNIGIFKDMLQKYCQKCNIFQTSDNRVMLNNQEKTRETLEEIVKEAQIPLHDRLINLAKPQRERRESKHIRLKIIIAILRIISRDCESVSTGIGISDIQKEVNTLCKKINEDKVDISNLAQELGMLHLREENKTAAGNYISLFFYDKANKKLLVLEPTIYLIKNYSVMEINSITDELMDVLDKYNTSDKLNESIDENKFVKL